MCILIYWLMDKSMYFYVWNFSIAIIFMNHFFFFFSVGPISIVHKFSFHFFFSFVKWNKDQQNKLYVKEQFNEKQKKKKKYRKFYYSFFMFYFCDFCCCYIFTFHHLFNIIIITSLSQWYAFEKLKYQLDYCEAMKLLNE